jgi:hypothetical protein
MKTELSTREQARQAAGGRRAPRAAGLPTQRSQTQRPAVQRPPVQRPPVQHPPVQHPAPQRSVAPRSAPRGQRTPFILLVLGLLGGGLICLLVINTTLATASFQINKLQQGNTELSQQEQTLQQQIATEKAPGAIERRAYQLGMRQQQHLIFLNARTGRISRQPSVLPNVPNEPGFTP